MPRFKKTTLIIEVSDREYCVRYNGTFSCPQTPEQRKHNERLMRAIYANDQLLNFLYNIVTPVVRCKRREAKKQPSNP
jgi:hypothetical protein